MTERLREEMLRVGDAVPPIHVPGDLWARGRRARRRDRVVSGVVALSVIGLIFAISMAGWPGVGRGTVAPVTPSGGAGAVPSTLHGVPQRLLRSTEERSWDPDRAEIDLAIGRASVAFTVGEGDFGPVAVSARDGRYHLLELPGWIGTGIGAASDGAALALSPDGLQLAWAWWDPSAPESGPMPGGVRIANLETGAVRTISLKGKDGVIVSALSWSPDSRWLAWQGREQNIWTTGRTGSGPDSAVAGRIAAGATVSTPVPLGRASASIAVAPSGELLLIGSEGWRTWGGKVVGRGSVLSNPELDLPSDGRAGALAPDGIGAALQTFSPSGSANFLAPGRKHSAGTPPRAVVSRELPLDSYPEGAIVDPLGWIDSDHVVALVTPAHGVSESGWTYGEKALVLMSAPWAEEDSFGLVTSFDEEYARTGWIQNLTIAVDLMTLEHPTEDFPAPVWPWSDEHRALVIGLSVASGFGLLLLGRRWLRRR
jgi:hypothetical protein